MWEKYFVEPVCLLFYELEFCLCHTTVLVLSGNIIFYHHPYKIRCQFLHSEKIFGGNRTSSEIFFSPLIKFALPNSALLTTVD